MKHWKCHWGRGGRQSATTRFTHGCLLALLFRFTYFKTGVSKGKQSHSQAFSIDHLSMQAVWPGTNLSLHLSHRFCYFSAKNNLALGKKTKKTSMKCNKIYYFRLFKQYIFTIKVNTMQAKVTAKKKWGKKRCLFSFSTPCVILGRY